MVFYFYRADMQGKKILIGISGSIAAYKIPELTRQFIKQGAEVQVMMTPSAKDFVSELALGTLTRKPVLVDMFDKDTWSNHVMLGRWADCILLAPTSCNTLAKLAHGLCDNFMLATCLSATCPIILAPAMDEDMWHHPTTQSNLQTLQKNGCHIIPSEHGELASGLTGMGRMAELDTIVSYVTKFLNPVKELQGKTVLITAGPTYENLDPVRFIGNYSSGKMGIALAENFASKGANVQLVLGPTDLTTNVKGITIHPVRSAEQMYKKAVSIFKKANIAVMSAAVADFTPKVIAKDKIKKGANEGMTIELVRTKDILKQLGTVKAKNQYLVGFALETANEEANAKKKLKEKNADMIVLNSLRDEGAGFAGDTNKVNIYTKAGLVLEGQLNTKVQVAEDIVQHIIKNTKGK
ncbi:MAG: bifunctional phosphopantothenoylcysteine decarboxylase/phosphopantothenate--cysteine ligase CoaBC [Bacteroidota bacterium]|jgi:phosphopantothenoylcysteine decarboxylase/phosphopantothenate--cysteine ligase